MPAELVDRPKPPYIDGLGASFNLEEIVDEKSLGYWCRMVLDLHHVDGQPRG
jgi:hypothetical protein